VFFALLFFVSSFSTELPNGFETSEQDGVWYLSRYNTPILVAKTKERLFSLIEEHIEIIDFWRKAPTVVLEYHGPEDLKDDVLNVIQNLGIALGNGKKLKIKLRISDDYVLIEVSYGSQKLNNYASLSNLTNWKTDLSVFLKKLLDLPDVINIPHVLFIETFGNKVKYNDKISSRDLLIITSSKSIDVEILEGQKWRKLQFKFQKPADVWKLNYFDVEIQTFPESAKLFVDEQYIGETPLVVKLKGGIHTLEIKSFRYKTIKKSIYIDGKQSLKYDLEKLEDGILNLSLNISEATITIDDRVYKTLNGKLSVGLNPGIHNITVEAKNRETSTEKVQLNPGENKNLIINLKGIIGTKDWDLLIDVQKIEDLFPISRSELILYLRDHSLICLNPIRRELCWVLKGFKDVLAVHKYDKKFLILCKDSLWLVRNKQSIPILKLSNESFITWDFDNLIFATNSGKLYKLSKITLKTLWIRKGHPILQILFDENLLFMLDVYRNIYCYNVKTMELIWKKHLKDAMTIYVNNGKLYVVLGKYLTILEDISGREIKRIEFFEPVEKLIILKDAIFIVLKDRIESLNNGKLINRKDEKVLSDENNIYLIDNKKIKIYFSKSGELDSKEVELSEIIMDVKTTNECSIILVCNSGKLVKIFGANGY